jgi:hypothetical protein
MEGKHLESLEHLKGNLALSAGIREGFPVKWHLNRDLRGK